MAQPAATQGCGLGRLLKIDNKGRHNRRVRIALAGGADAAEQAAVDFTTESTEDTERKYSPCPPW